MTRTAEELILEQAIKIRRLHDHPAPGKDATEEMKRAIAELIVTARILDDDDQAELSKVRFVN